MNLSPFLLLAWAGGRCWQWSPWRRAAARPRPGVLPLLLTFAWRRPAPVLYLAAEDDVPVPLAGVRELFDRTPQARQLEILRHADRPLPPVRRRRRADEIDRRHRLPVHGPRS